MRFIPMADAKSRLSAVIDAVEAGEEIVITRRGVAVARLVPEKASRQRAATAWVGELATFVAAQKPSRSSSVAQMRAEDGG